MEKEKKMIIILSITSGALLLLLLISSGYNYKQYNDNNTCTTSSRNLDSTAQNVQSGLAALQTKLASSETNSAGLQTKLAASETNSAGLQTKLATLETKLEITETNLARLQNSNLGILDSKLQTLQNSQSEILTKQQTQLKEIINVVSKNSDKTDGLPTPDQIDCLLKQVNQKYTPFDILYNIISFIFASMSKMVVENKGTTPWANSIVSTLVDMRNVGCGSVQTCNIPSSSDVAKACQQEFN